MFDEPNEDEGQADRDKPLTPTDRAKEKSDEFRMHAELAAVFEGARKFEAQLRPGFDPELAREIQRGFGKLEKSKAAEHPVLPAESMPEAAKLLGLAKTRGISTSDYHIHRRPGEVVVIRWLNGDEVDHFYERLQAHFDAAMNAFRQEERASQEWKKDAQTLAYLDALDAVQIKMDERYLREPIRKHRIFVLSTQTADEINIKYLAEYIMGVGADELVGPASAPPEEPSERDLAWFYKLFSLRGVADDGQEQMCFFMYLQKTDDSMEIEA